MPNLGPLFEHGVLLDLDIGYWTARKRNDEEDLGIEPGDVPDYVVGLGTKRLVPKQYTDEWQNCSGRARRIVGKYSRAFPLTGASFITMAALPVVEEKLVEEKATFEKSRDEFGKHFDTIKKEFLASLDKGDRERIAADIPAKEVVMGKFYFVWLPLTIELPKKLKLQALNREKAAAHAAAQARYERELEHRVASFLETSVSALRAKTIEVFDAVSDRIKSGEVVTNRSLNTLRAHIDHFKMLNLVGDREVEGRLTKLQKDLLADDAKAFSEDAARKALVGACDEIVKAAKHTSDIGSVTGQFRRRLAL